MVTLSKSISMAALGAWAGGSNEELPRSLPEIGWFTALSVHSPDPRFRLLRVTFPPPVSGKVPKKRTRAVRWMFWPLRVIPDGRRSSFLALSSEVVVRLG